MKSRCPKSLHVFALFLPLIRQHIKERNFLELRSTLKNLHSIDIAEGWSRLEPSEKIIVFRLLGSKKAVEVFENLKLNEQRFILDNLNNEEVSQIINEMAPDERADLFKELPEKVSRKLFTIVKKEDIRNIRTLMEFPEGTAGSLMTTDFVELKKEMNARQALLKIQESLRAEFSENVYSLYVTDDAHRLIGMLSLQQLLKAPPDMCIRDLMHKADFIKIEAHTPSTEVAQWFKRYDLLDAPVVDKDNVLLGVITVDDIVENIEKEATKNLYEIGKMSAEGGELISYTGATVWDLVRRRAGWLVLLLIFDFLTGTVLKNFEHTLSTVVALTFFIPMLLDTGGNAGAQTAITVIRGLATGDVSFSNVWRVVRLELSSAILMGLIVGTVAWARAFLLQKDFILAIVVGTTMFLIALLAICTGVSLPLLSKRVGIDPAALAGPITTSIVDVLGLIIYFKVAQAFIPALRF
ncbi:MAG: magnesium transporter [Candidatus Omnitrophica bacterium]|nr:magnesium transporter [Candidatus Omnitrophota bacterium]